MNTLLGFLFMAVGIFAGVALLGSLPHLPGPALLLGAGLVGLAFRIGYGFWAREWAAERARRAASPPRPAGFVPGSRPVTEATPEEGAGAPRPILALCLLWVAGSRGMSFVSDLASARVADPSVVLGMGLTVAVPFLLALRCFSGSSPRPAPAPVAAS